MKMKHFLLFGTVLAAPLPASSILAQSNTGFPSSETGTAPFYVAEAHMPAGPSDFSSSARPAESNVLTLFTAAGASSGDQRPDISSTRPFSAVGMAATVGLAGIGFELATPLARKVNVRGGASFFGYSATVKDSGTTYDGHLQLRSGQVGIDWFPFGGSFRLSGGVELYNGNQITANAAISAGQSFTENGTTYYSSAADPVHGTASLLLGNKAGPTFSFGWGNIVPRKRGSHFSVPFELGAVYTGTPKLAIDLTGSICNSSGTSCQTIAGNSTFQQNIAAQQSTYQNDLSPLRFYPILSIGLGYKF